MSCMPMCASGDGLTKYAQGFRKYLTQARDHEELLAFILGQIIKEKVREYQLTRNQQPNVISVKVSQLEERVRLIFLRCECHLSSCHHCNTGKGTRHLRRRSVPPVEAVRGEWLHARGRDNWKDVQARR